MTNNEKLLKLLQYYMDCYAHCEGSGCWDSETLAKFDIDTGMCWAWLWIYGKGDVTDFLPKPPKQLLYGYDFWFIPPCVCTTDSQRRAAVKVRIEYMIKHLK